MSAVGNNIVFGATVKRTHGNHTWLSGRQFTGDEGLQCDHNIISDSAHLQLTVRNTNLETRDKLLAGIERIALNLGRAAGLPEDKLPEVIVSTENTPPTVNDDQLVRRLKKVWQNQLGDNKVVSISSQGMGAEDFPYFTTDPAIASVYFSARSVSTTST